MLPGEMRGNQHRLEVRRAFQHGPPGGPWRRAAQLPTLEDVLVQEFRVSCASLRSHDFVEGNRAQVIDKDRNPQWSPASPEEVTDDDVAAYFLPAAPDLIF